MRAWSRISRPLPESRNASLRRHQPVAALPHVCHANPIASHTQPRRRRDAHERIRPQQRTSSLRSPRQYRPSSNQHQCRHPRPHGPWRRRPQRVRPRLTSPRRRRQRARLSPATRTDRAFQPFRRLYLVVEVVRRRPHRRPRLSVVCFSLSYSLFGLSLSLSLL